MNIGEIERFTKTQFQFLDMISEIVKYDQENGKPAENTRVLTAFCDTQRRALEMVQKLIDKHKPAILEAEKKEKEKQEAARQLEAAKKKEETKKENIKKDLEKAQKDDTSLFSFADNEEKTEQACIFQEEPEEETDGYSFEEEDMERDDE